MAKIAAIASVWILCSCGCSKIQSESLRVEPVMVQGQQIPVSAVSISDLEKFGKVVEITSHWCVLLYFAPAEGIGYGRAVIYRNTNDSWLLHKSTEEILLPEAKLRQDKIVITKEASLNDSTRVEVMSIDIDR